MEKLIKFGFFISQDDQTKLMPLLIGLLDGKKEKVSGSAKFQRYEMSEATLPIMVLFLDVLGLTICRKLNFKFVRFYIRSTIFDWKKELQSNFINTKFNMKKIEKKLSRQSKPTQIHLEKVMD
jgi:hypothetical protein